MDCNETGAEDEQQLPRDYQNTTVSSSSSQRVANQHKNQTTKKLKKKQQQHKSKYNHHQNNRRPKYKKKRLFWIQDCPDLIPLHHGNHNNDSSSVSSILIRLTEIHLQDNIQHGCYSTTASSNGQSDLAEVDTTHSLQIHPELTMTSATNSHVHGKVSQTVTDISTVSNEAPLMSSKNCIGNKEVLDITATTITAEALDAANEPVFRTKDDDNIALLSSTKSGTANNVPIQECSNIVHDQQPKIYIQRIPYTGERETTIDRNNTKYVELPNGNNGDGICNPYPNSLVPNKYWAQRKRFFHLFDDGIQMNHLFSDDNSQIDKTNKQYNDDTVAEAWYSVTPQCIANHIATRMLQQHLDSCTDHDQPFVVVDAFVGVGGNAIALAKATENVLVICIDIHIEKLYCAANNCQIYQIPKHKVAFIHGNSCDILSTYYRNGLLRHPVSTLGANTYTHDGGKDMKRQCGYKFGTASTADVLPQSIHGIFLSPPWGGLEYEEIGPRHYNLSCIQLTVSSCIQCNGKTEVTTSRIDEDGNNETSNDNMIDGEELLQLAVSALPANQLNIAYYLPRNLNGTMFGYSCYKTLCRHFPNGTNMNDCGAASNHPNPTIPTEHYIELEQNVVNTKLKTITAYIQSHKLKK